MLWLVLLRMNLLNPPNPKMLLLKRNLSSKLQVLLKVRKRKLLLKNSHKKLLKRINKKLMLKSRSKSLPRRPNSYVKNVVKSSMKDLVIL